MVAASNSYTHTTWLRFWGTTGSLVETNWCHYIVVETASSTSICFLHPYQTYTKCLSTLICCLWAYVSSLKQLYPHYLVQILGFWIICGVKMMSLHHSSGCQPPQTASRIHLKHIHNVLANWYAVYGHRVAALNSYTHTTWLRFWGSPLGWSQNDGIISRLRLTATSICSSHP